MQLNEGLEHGYWGERERDGHLLHLEIRFLQRLKQIPGACGCSILPMPTPPPPSRPSHVLKGNTFLKPVPHSSAHSLGTAGIKMNTHLRFCRFKFHPKILYQMYSDMQTMYLELDIPGRGLATYKCLFTTLCFAKV